jgi:hypothetical protein
MELSNKAVPRKKALDNPFNPGHFLYGGKPWSISKTVPQPRTELKRRDLPYNGTRAELVKRMEQHNKWILTWDGRRERYHRKLGLFKQAALANAVPFDRFPSFLSRYDS